MFFKAHLKIIHQNEWWFSIIDVVEVLTELIGRGNMSDLKKKLEKEGYVEVSDKIGQLKMTAPDGKMRETDCANTETLFRIIQSIPSSKAEPLKRWLAKVGYERVQEIEDPELATKRTRMLYKLKGYSEDWIEKRIRGIAIREELTDEWQKRELGKTLITQFDRRNYKRNIWVDCWTIQNSERIKTAQLRDHMNDIELI